MKFSFLLSFFIFVLRSCVPDNNAISYETCNSQPLSLDVRMNFGAHLVDHIFSDGKGKLIFDGPISEIPDDAFQQTALSVIEIPETVKKIGVGAFALCVDLEKCNIPVSCDSIGRDAFLYCSFRLEESIHLENVTYIGPMAFFGCYSLNNIQLSNRLRNIEPETFAGSGLRCITLPEHIDSIQKRAFYGCKELKQVRNFDSVKYLGEGTFGGCAFDTVIIPLQLKEIPDNCFENNRYLKHVELHSNIRRIGKSAFWNCSSLSNIEIPQGIVCIGDNAFAFCKSLQRVVIPESVDSLGTDVFNASPFHQ